MRVPHSHRSGDISENMMTSMIDVVFLLLIFFVVAAAGHIRETLLPQHLPPGSIASLKPVRPPESPDAPDKIWVYLSLGERGQPVMKLNGTDYESFEKLRDVLKALGEVASENPLILDIDDNVPAGEMIRVYDTCRAAGFRQINFNVRPEKPDAPRPGERGQ